MDDIDAGVAANEQSVNFLPQYKINTTHYCAWKLHSALTSCPEYILMLHVTTSKIHAYAFYCT